ncbi:hypothetical protein STCU_11821 [Strigomonas culicis]|uniref:Uncharacterized protein n=1 Tax=Strigomonas culicis TaxID=28005 RepID=S9UYV4_9TRYP|nr:hypothetical protein STCU_11821 [Strigomonas culicis]|eukprot:EPY15705.1 hypothetical protein STCU_11821 [Strigomonas culicis]
MASTPPPQHASSRGGQPTAARRLADPIPVLPPFEATSTLLEALRAQVDHSMKYYLYDNAIFYAERLFDQCPSHRHLHTLANCHVAAGDPATARRLLLHHYPFFFQRGQSLESAVAALLRAGGAGAAADYVAALWDCQYLLGVCCCRAQRHGEAHGVLRELVELSTLLPNVAFCSRPGYVPLQDALRLKERPMLHRGSGPRRAAMGARRRTRRAWRRHCGLLSRRTTSTPRRSRTGSGCANTRCRCSGSRTRRAPRSTIVSPCSATSCSSAPWRATSRRSRGRPRTLCSSCTACRRRRPRRPAGVRTSTCGCCGRISSSSATRCSWAAPTSARSCRRG